MGKSYSNILIVLWGNLVCILQASVVEIIYAAIYLEFSSIQNIFQYFFLMSSKFVSYMSCKHYFSIYFYIFFHRCIRNDRHSRIRYKKEYLYSYISFFNIKKSVVIKKNNAIGKRVYVTGVSNKSSHYCEILMLKH